MFDTLDISSSALTAQRIRMDTIAGNVAGLSAGPGNKAHPPYQRRFVVMSPGQAEDSSKPGVHVESVQASKEPFRVVHDPSHPMHDADGNVLYPNIDLMIEVTNMLEASRAYEANVTAMEVTKAMMNASLRILA